jgi:gentisate 1,2-dioxygenase
LAGIGRKITEYAMSDIRTFIKSKSKDLSLVGLWDVVNQVELAEPIKSYQPHIWYWKDLRPLMLEAGKNIPLSEADRRVMILSNPSVYPKHYSTNTLYVSCSIYNPGETAPVHRHTPSASRFVLEGDGGYTSVEGEKILMSRGDLIITPNGTWHDHGNEGKNPVLWVDVLDLPLVEMLGSTQFEFEMEEGPDARSNSKEKVKRDTQPVLNPIGHSTNLYAAGGLTPTFVNHQRGRSRATPMLLYRWEDTEKALNRLRQYEGSPYDGVMLEYTNPINGEPVTTTMSFLVQLLRPGEHTKRHRHTSSTAYCCLKGKGKTIVGDKTLEWGPNDMFVIPSWAWHEHVNGSSTEDAVLYSVSDAATLHRLGLYREEVAA